ncbi:pentapeptide repeat-containing protein [Haliscomenobacter sp.]|uniref:pentapeptide repeat-containing protein n=1 Tax=Haliscomenobacter sp. TaxID=2717303 RepID=UPI003BAD8EA0
MANQNQIEILKKGVDYWNNWRKHNPLEKINLNGFDFTTIEKIFSYDSDGNKYESQFWRFNFKNANLSNSIFSHIYFLQTEFLHSNLEGVYFNDCTLKACNLSNSNLRNSNLKGCKFVGSDLSYSDLSESYVFGSTVWMSNLENAIQNNLVITPPNQSKITLDNIEVAQFIYNLMGNQKLKEHIDTINQKVVLILGRFQEEQKMVLDSIRVKLREKNFIPIVFDFENSNRTVDETVGLLARMSRFIIADLTNAKSILQELRGIVPELPSVPIRPIIHHLDFEHGMIDFFKKFPWFLQIQKYQSKNQLIENIDDLILSPIEKYFQENK